jgi:hypothetical protein
MTGDLSLADKIVHTGDTNTAIRFPAADTVTIETAGSERVRVDSNGQLGIGVTSVDTALHVKSANDTVAIIESSDATAKLQIKDSDSTNGASLSVTNETLNIQVNGGTRATIDSSGNLLVGTTSSGVASSSSNAGIQLNSSADYIAVARSGGTALYLNRQSSDGTIADFRKDGTTVGTIGSVSGDIFFAGVDNNHAALRFAASSKTVIPVTTAGALSDNTTDLGQSNAQFDDIFASNSTIQPSDQTMKQDIASLTSAEITAAKAISKLFKTFKWKDKVTSKGDSARTHAGVIAQEVQSAMSDAGLDATKYAFFCSDTWYETYTDVPAVEANEENGTEEQDAYTRTDTYNTADEAPEGATERTRLGVRYPELLAFIGAATEQRLADIETRLTALEAS